MFSAATVTRPANEAVRRAPARKSVLVVDDSGVSRMIMCTSLMREGILVRAAKSAREALDSIGEERPGLILTDIDMPQVDGFELLDLVHELDPSLPVVLISGSVDTGLRLRAAQRGAAGVVTKSADQDDFIELIRSRLAA